MKWSQLKKRAEAGFAEAVAGRVQVWNTRYRAAADQEGEAWITFDGQRIASFGTMGYWVQTETEAERLRSASGNTDWRDPAQAEGYFQAGREADQAARKRGVFPMWSLNEALFDLLNLPIDEAIQSENPLIRAFATLDRRFGKRRLRAFDDAEEHPLVRLLFRLRYEAEGLSRKPDAPPSGE